MMKRSFLVLGFLLLCISSFQKPASAWWPKGHGILSEAAVRALPDEMPKFFRDNGKAVAHHSYDPDVAKNKATPLASNTESPEHFIDWELIEKPLSDKYPNGSKALPETRYEFLKFCFQNNIEPNSVGLLPYALAEWTERLTVAFAEHRRWPQNKRTQEKCLLYAGILAHYAEDLCQPLHVTLHHDGKAKADGSSPKSGIHGKTDGLIEILALSPKELARNQKIEPLQNLLPGILAEIHNSRTHIETVYSLEPALPTEKQTEPSSLEVVQFTNQRGREATRFTASLFLTAWRNSAQVELPNWLERSAK